MLGYSRTALRAGSFVAMVFCAHAIFAAAPAAPAHYVLEPSKSLLRFSFVQAGATNSGRFGKYTADVLFSSENLAASKINVTVDITSLDTGDQERDDTLKGADLFDVKKFREARFVSTKIVSTGQARYEAQGKLTIRNVTKDVKVPITFQTKVEQVKTMGYLTGRMSIRRLEYGVGQGEWKSTEWVNDDVSVTFSLRLTPATT
jgi:polyisoprenoid-binding protein YceI